MSNSIKTRSVLIDNFKQSELISPQHKFEALQTQDGFALLFSIATDGHFYLTSRQEGSKAPWKKEALSSDLDKQLGATFASKTFAIAENKSSNKINVALAITANGADHLFLSFGHSNQSGAINKDSIQWVSAPFNDPNYKQEVKIANTFISPLADQQFVVADLLQEDGFYKRYHVTKSDSGFHWQEAPSELQVNEKVISCLGKIKPKGFPGMYNLSAINAEQELSFTDLPNPFGIVNTLLLTCPAKANNISTISTDAATKVTDLFISAEDGLYYYPSNLQTSVGKPIHIVEDPIFDGVTKLFSCFENSKCIVWGLNRANQIFHTECEASQMSESQSWSLPLPILNSVDAMSPFINKVDSANSFMGIAGKELKIARQEVSSTLWNIENVDLPAPIPSGKLEQVHLISIRHGAKEEISLKADARAIVEVNGLYQILDRTPVLIQTHGKQLTNIVQKANNLTPNTFTIIDGSGTEHVVDPKKSLFKDIHSKLGTVGGLQAAQYNDLAGSPKKILPSGVPESKLQKAANNIQLLAQINSNKVESIAQYPTEFSVLDIKSDLGDLLSWFGNEAEGVYKIVHESGVWKLIINLPGKVYHAVISGIEDILAVAGAIFKSIGILLDDLINFLKHPILWKNIWNTHVTLDKILHNGASYLKTAIGGSTEKFTEIINKGMQKATGMVDQLQIPTQFAKTTLDDLLGKALPKKVAAAQDHTLDWLAYQLSHNLPTDVFESIEAKSINPLQDLLTEMKAFIKGPMSESLGEVFKDKEHFKTVFLNPKIDIGQIFEMFQKLATDSVGFAGSFVQKLVAKLGELIDFVCEKVKIGLDIPIISSFIKSLEALFGGYRSSTSSALLLLSVPLVSIYSGVHGGLPFEHGSSIATDPSFFHQTFTFSGISAQETLADGGFLNVYTKYCQPIGGILGLISDYLTGCADLSNLNFLMWIETIPLNVLSTFLTIDIPEGDISIAYYIIKWAIKILIDLLVGSVGSFIPEPGDAIAELLIHIFDLYYFVFDIALAIGKGADDFENWVPLIIDASNEFGSVMAEIGLVLTGAGQDSVLVGAELVWLIPLGLPLAASGMGIAFLADVAEVVTGIVLD